MTPQVAAIPGEVSTIAADEPRRLQAGDTPLPPTLRALLESQDARDAAWDDFIAEYSHLLLHVVKSVPGTRDDRMDIYARILESLRDDDCRRLRSYIATPGTKFTTWLVVVSKRICIDYHRMKFGRTSATGGDRAMMQRKVRRELESLVAGPADVAEVASEESQGADETIRQAELARAVTASLRELSPPDRLLIALRFRDGLSTPEIARVMHGRSALSVYRRLGKVLEQLRDSLRDRGIHDPEP